MPPLSPYFLLHIRTSHVYRINSSLLNLKYGLSSVNAGNRTHNIIYVPVAFVLFTLSLSLNFSTPGHELCGKHFNCTCNALNIFPFHLIPGIPCFSCSACATMHPQHSCDLFIATYTEGTLRSQRYNPLVIVDVTSINTYLYHYAQ